MHIGMGTRQFVFCQKQQNMNDKMQAAIRSGDTAALTEILEEHPEWVDQPDERGFRPLVLATYLQQPEIATLLLEKGANINARDGAGNTALMGVVFKGDKGLTALLIDKGASINLQNYSGATALIYAVSYGHHDIVRLLIEKGADQNAIDREGKTARDHAKDKQDTAMMELLG